MPEWLIGTVCKTVVLTGFAGSNPALSTTFSKLRGPAIRKEVRAFLVMETRVGAPTRAFETVVTYSCVDQIYDD